MASTPRYETKAIEATPASADAVRQLVADGWLVTGRSHGTVRLARPVADSVPETAPAHPLWQTEAGGPFPGADALRAAGVPSPEAALALSDDALLAIDGVGTKTAEKIAALRSPGTP